MKKRFLSVVLAAVMVLSLSVSALAADAQVSEEEAAQVLAALDIMTGDENGALHLDQAVTRAEFTKLTIAASSHRSSVGPTASVSPYPDVPKTSWAAPWIQCAKENGIVTGNLYGKFEPDRSITLVEGVTMALRLLGYQNSDFTGKWGSGQMSMYQSLKLDYGISIGRDDPMTRRDALYLFYNLLTAKMKDGKTVYLTSLGHTLTAAGEIDRVALVNSAMEGPVVAEGNWRAAVPFDVSTAKVYRNGGESALSSIQELDVVYYSKPLRTLWCWSGKVTGTIQALTPSASAPTSVTVANRVYPLSTPDAAYALSDLGSFRAGDSVTLLLGRDGGVAAVRAPGAVSAATAGVVTATGTGTFQDKDGSSYTAGTVTVTATDGASYTFRYENKNNALKAGDLVQVTPVEDGFQVKQVSSAKLTGKVDAAGSGLGSYSFADQVEILDTYGDTGTLRVYPSRLAGVDLQGNMVRWYSLNSQGEIDRLILNDVTGDIHQYGVLTDVSEVDLGAKFSSTYRCDVGGSPLVLTSSTSMWNLKKGPCQIRMDGTSLKRIYNLSGVTLTSVSGNTATASNRTYTLSDAVAVYELREKSYYLTDLSRVSAGGFNLTGYYDKAETEGGRIRVIVATSSTPPA